MRLTTVDTYLRSIQLVSKKTKKLATTLNLQSTHSQGHCPTHLHRPSCPCRIRPRYDKKPYLPVTARVHAPRKGKHPTEGLASLGAGAARLFPPARYPLAISQWSPILAARQEGTWSALPSLQRVRQAACVLSTIHLSASIPLAPIACSTLSTPPQSPLMAGLTLRPRRTR